jgi:protein-disulfide isomerase
MKKQPEAKSGMPMLIIGGVFIVAIIVAWYWIGSAKTTPTSNRAANSATAGNTAKTPGIPTNAPPGAQPPNMAGSETAAVTIEEFADYQCGSCASVHPAMNEIKSLYGSRIKFIFRNYPLSIPAHDKSYLAAVTAEAAGMQGKFWEMQNALFTNQQNWTTDPNYRELWKGYAKKIGLNVEKLDEDVAGIAAKSRVDADLERGRILGISSTPTVYVNGVSIPFGDMKTSTLKTLIDSEIQKASSTGQPAANTK